MLLFCSFGFAFCWYFAGKKVISHSSFAACSRSLSFVAVLLHKPASVWCCHHLIHNGHGAFPVLHSVWLTQKVIRGNVSIFNSWHSPINEVGWPEEAAIISHNATSPSPDWDHISCCIQFLIHHFHLDIFHYLLMRILFKIFTRSRVCYLASLTIVQLTL